MSGWLITYIFLTLATAAIAGLTAMSFYNDASSYNGDPVTNDRLSRRCTLMALLCWAWPIMVVVWSGYGLGAALAYATGTPRDPRLRAIDADAE